MSKEHKRYKKIQKYEPSDGAICCAVVDLFAILLLVTSLILDYFYHDIINNGIVALSIDSLLTLISILGSIYVPINDDRTLKKYYINPDDYGVVKKTSNCSYVNLLVVAILLFVINVFLYAFQFNLSLIVTVLISVAYIVVFVIPRLYEGIKGDDTILSLVKTKFNAYRLGNDNWFDIEHSNSSEGDYIKSLNKMIEGVLIKRGFENTLSLLSETIDRSGQDKHNERTKIYLYLVKVQDQLISDINDSRFNFPLDSNIINQCIENTYYLLFSSSELTNVFLKEDSLSSASSAYISKMLDNLNSIVETNPNNNSSQSFLTITKKLLNIRGYHDSSLFYLSIIYSLLVYSLSKEETWFVEQISELIDLGGVLSHHNFLIYICILLCSYSIRYKVLNDSLLEELSLILETEFAGVRHRILLKEETTNFKNFIKLSKKVDFKKMHKDLQKGEELSKSLTLLSNYLKKSIDMFPIFFILLNYRNNYSKLDDLLLNLNGDSDVILKECNQKSDINRMFDIFRDHQICDSDYTNQEVDRLYSHIANFENRDDEIEMVKRIVKFDTFKENISSLFNELTWVRPANCRDDSLIEDSRSYDIKMTYYIDKNTPLIDKEGKTTIDLNNILKQFFIHFNGSYYSPIPIDDYSQESINKILSINPVYMNAHCFIKYCKDKAIDLPAIKETDFYFYHSPNCEIFYGQGAFNLSIQLDTDSYQITYIYEKDARTHFKDYDDDSIRELIRSHVALTFSVNCKLFYNINKVLIYYLPKKKTKRVKH